MFVKILSCHEKQNHRDDLDGHLVYMAVAGTDP